MVLLRTYKKTAYEIDSFGLQSLTIDGLFCEQKFAPPSPTKKEQVSDYAPVPTPLALVVPSGPSRRARYEHVYLMPANPNPKKGRHIDPDKVSYFLSSGQGAPEMTGSGSH